MTLVCAIKQGASAYLYADSAYVDPKTGVVAGFEPKLLVGSRFPYAVGVTLSGPLKSSNVLGDLDVSSVAALAHSLPVVCERYRQGAMREGYLGSKMRLVAAAWDDYHKIPRIFVAGDGAEAYGCQPHQYIEMDFTFGCAIEIRDIWNWQSPMEPEHFDVRLDSIEIYERFRASGSAPINGLPPGCYTGGQLSMASVSESGVKAEMIYSWPDDVIGRPIVPLISVSARPLEATPPSLPLAQQGGSSSRANVRPTERVGSSRERRQAVV